jgi:nicotinamide-nucleotide amidase
MNSSSLLGEADFARLVAQLADCLVKKGWTLATAESCTGGWIAKCCTDLAGSSAWFERGFVTYSDISKQEMLGVSPEVIDSQGAVSREVAELMAQGARRRTGVNASLSVTGIAGPDGGSQAKPVGTVWFGWSLPGKAPDSELMCFKGDREAIRRQTVRYALAGLLARIRQ